LNEGCLVNDVSNFTLRFSIAVYAVLLFIPIIVDPSLRPSLEEITSLGKLLRIFTDAVFSLFIYK